MTTLPTVGQVLEQYNPKIDDNVVIDKLKESIIKINNAIKYHVKKYLTRKGGRRRKKTSKKPLKNLIEM